MHIGIILSCLSVLLCSSCTSTLMEKGERPWRLHGASKSTVDDAYGAPSAFGHRFPYLDATLEAQGNLRPSWGNYVHYGLYDIRGPFPEPDTTKSLEALYASVFTLGLAEIVMLPPTAIGKFIQRDQTRPFIFLYDGTDVALCIVPASTNMLSVIENRDKNSANN